MLARCLYVRVSCHHDLATVAFTVVSRWSPPRHEVERGTPKATWAPNLSRHDPGRFHGKELRTPSIGRFVPLAQALEVSRDQLLGDMRPLRPRWIRLFRPFDLEFELIFSCCDTVLQNALYCILRTFRDFVKFPGAGTIIGAFAGRGALVTRSDHLGRL